ncbi:molybdopterin synthase sulfur carrier subunit [Coccinella septempunctata]|uniref:molybdopterin synthase sulfur carrier subunit n=1 Tax=Coccinella septempunctata TaxID=41139 RepID=UPI001D062AC3|nr:molybdopterin synthase sulfur carrier subunit [Coccinella septempunctata]
MNVEVNILFFAKAREIVGKTNDSLAVETPITYHSLLNLIAEKYCLQEIKNNVILAVNKQFGNPEDSYCLKRGDEIAIIPPLSGG